jgi:hypothetical protein
MKKAKMHFAIVVLSILIIPASALAIPSVTLDFSGSSVNVGDIFTIDVVAHGITDFDSFWGFDELLSFGFTVDYSSAFTFDGAIISSDFFDDSALFPDVAGHVFPGITGDNILLANLNFTALSSGDFSLGISSDISTGQGLLTFFYDPIDITTSIPITVNSSASAVPEPATLILLIPGLTGLAIIQLRKRVL